MARIGVIRAGEQSVWDVAAVSCAALDRPLSGDAELWVAVVRDEAVLTGAFQRASPGRGAPRLPEIRRGSGGPEVRAGEGTVHVALALTHPGALTPCDESRIVNRSVRPLLRALTRTAGLAHFFGRDWVSVLHQPVAWVGFAHDATTRRTLFEAFVALRTPFAVGARASFRGKTATTLEALAGRPLDPHRIADAVADAYAGAYQANAIDVRPAAALLAGQRPRGAAPIEPPWTATAEEAIGTLGAGNDAAGVFRVGGDLLVSRDALARLEARAAVVPEDQVGHLVDETLAAPGVALDGVQALSSLRDLILRARLGPSSRP